MALTPEEFDRVLKMMETFGAHVEQVPAGDPESSQD
jgi:hypothetical protein